MLQLPVKVMIIPIMTDIIYDCYVLTSATGVLYYSFLVCEL